MFKILIHLYNLEKYVLSTYNLPDRKFEVIGLGEGLALASKSVISLVVKH